jgi:hypothetical protein
MLHEAHSVGAALVAALLGSRKQAPTRGAPTLNVRKAIFGATPGNVRRWGANREPDQIA